MNFLRNIIICFCIVLFISACNSMNKNSMNLKSPCVDNGGPCQHIPVNNWWLNEIAYKA